MARFSGGSGGGSGTPGPRGPRGFDGEDGVDALWNYTGEYNGGASYAVGDVATYDGQLWYRANANGGNVGDTPSEGFIWNLLAAKGEDGTDASGGLVYLGDYVSGNGYVANIAIVRGSDSNLYIAKDSGGLQDPVGNTAQWDIFSNNAGGSADIADFVFEYDENDENSTITIHNHDMVIQTTRDDVPEGEDLIDADIRIISADDFSVEANDEVEIRSTTNDVRIVTNNYQTHWTFQADGGLGFPDQTVQTTAYTGGDGFSLEPYGDIFGDSEPAGESRVVNLSYTFSEGPIDGIPIALDNRDALFVPIDDEDFVFLHDNRADLTELTLTLNDQTVLSVDGLAQGVYSIDGQEFPSGQFVLDTQITKTAEEIYPFTFNATRTYPGVTNRITIGVSSDVPGPDTDWVFDSDGNLITPVGSPRIVNLGVPGDITLSAYSGVELSFADVEGAGLKFPDQTVQTTAYTGGAGVDTGDITFVDSTISNDTGDDIVIQNKNEDGIVKASIRLDQSNEQVLIEAIASDSEWFNDTQWSTAVWAGSVVTITNTPDIINFFDNAPGNITRISINDGGLVTYEGASYGDGAIGINVGGTPPEGQDPLTVTEIRFYYSLVSRINIDHDDSEFEIISRGMSMTIDSSGDLELIARDEDIDLRANDDIRFTANWENSGTQREWRMDSEGRFQLPGEGYIENPADSSGDGSANDTIKIVPDDDLEDTDQYIIIDPTGGEPGHIHIRAGGAQDSSRADIILGGERAGVKVSDTDGTTTVRSKKEDYVWTYANANDAEGPVYIISSEVAEPDINDFMVMNGTKYVITSVTRNEQDGFTSYETTPSFVFLPEYSYTFTRNNGNYAWEFVAVDDRPVLVLPPEEPMIINSAVPGDITLSAYNGVKLSFSQEQEGAGLEFPDETVQTTAYIPSEVNSGEVSFTVNGGTLGTQPTFDGAPLFTGSYVKAGAMVHFRVDVDFDNILTFGTGQYYLNLPFTPKYNYMFTGGCLHDASTGRTYAINGHVFAGNPEMRLESTDNTGNVTFNIPFTATAPTALATADNFHIYGDFIVDPEAP